MRKRPIRVLQIIGEAQHGGVEAAIMNYYRYMHKNRVQFDFVAHKGANSDYIHEVQSMGGKFYEVIPYERNIFEFIYKIYIIIKQGSYTIVHSNMNSMSGFALFAAYAAGASVRILHNHTTDSVQEGGRTLLKRALRPFARWFANHHWACGYAAAEWMYGKRAMEKHPVTLIRNAIELERFAFDREKRDRLRKALGIDHQFVVGHIGRFVLSKNHAFLIDVFSEIVKQKEAVLLLIGEGALMSSVRERVIHAGLRDAVRFLGTYSDTAAFYSVMDVFLLPSLYEGLPLVAVEAQANGLPVLCAAQITKEVRVSENIAFLEIGAGAKRWADKALSLARRGQGAEIQKELTEAGFNIRIESRKLERLYETLENDRGCAESFDSYGRV